MLRILNESKDWRKLISSRYAGFFMTIRDFIQERQEQKKPILMDGGTGTEITRRGISTKLPLWSAEALMTAPDVVKAIHRDYIGAGAEVIITNTFRTQRRTLDKVGKGQEAERLTKLAVMLAKDAIKETNVDHKVWIAGSVAPLEDCYTPELYPGDKQAATEHAEHIRFLVEAGVDFILVETMNTIRETKVALKAAKSHDVPLAVSYCINEEGQLLSGESVEDMVQVAEPLNPLAIMINCSDPGASTGVLKKLYELTTLPLGVYANGMGEAHNDQGWIFEGGVSVKTYLGHVMDWIEAGAILVGGCCGTTPEYIRAIHTMITS